MTDCPNGSVRDQLPDLLHGRLHAAEAAQVQAHVDGCAECAAELALLRTIRHIAPSPAISVERIVATLPRGDDVSRMRTRRASRSAWWTGAAAAAVLATVGALALTDGPERSERPGSTIATVSSPVVDQSATATDALSGGAPGSSVDGASAATAVRTTGREAGAPALALGVLDDLSDAELRGMLSQIDLLDGLPDAAELDEDVLTGENESRR